jgi:hypothetical protein
VIDAETIERAQQRLRRAWASNTMRLIVLTVYYVAIIMGVARIHGERQYKPPPFIYQEF